VEIAINQPFKNRIAFTGLHNREKQVRREQTRGRTETERNDISRDDFEWHWKIGKVVEEADEPDGRGFEGVRIEKRGKALCELFGGKTVEMARRIGSASVEIAE
jgi:hypothetical protein